MIEHAPLQPRLLTDVELVNRLKRLHQPQEVETAVERADLAAGRDHGHEARAELERTDAVSFSPELRQLTLPFEAGDQRRTLRRSNNHGAVAFDLLRNGNFAAEQTRATGAEFAANGFERCGVAGRDDGSDAGTIDIDHFLRKRIVTQPQAIAVLGYRGNPQRE